MVGGDVCPVGRGSLPSFEWCVLSFVWPEAGVGKSGGYGGEDRDFFDVSSWLWFSFFLSFFLSLFG